MYQVWTKAAYEEGWRQKRCEDLEAAQQEILQALKRGEDPLLTVEVPFEVMIVVKEKETDEARKNQVWPGKGARDAGEGEVRPGAPVPVPGVD